MDLSEKQNLLAALKRGQVVVVFNKIDSDEVRVMPCTLNPEVLEANGVTNKVDITESGADSEHFAVWSLDKSAWRSFRLETVVSWEVLGD